MSGADGVAFETLIYTDCVPGQGLQGTAGLQFQARSAGADRAAMSLVQSAELYEAPANWMRERRPVGDYPPSFAHAYDGVYATAAGVYLGREANGGREGNQLTHAIVTDDAASYLLHRPAQLFGAPFWSTRPATTTECEPVRHPWESGPFDIEAAKALVTHSPKGAELLGKLLTSLQRLAEPNARRVLFISEDAGEVLGWISAATLLLPMREALGIGFKVFTTNPAYASQPVIAVHPGWDSTTVSVADDGGYVVFDLTRNEFSDVPIDGRAAHWVRLLLDEDPYDVLDLVETAAASGRKNPDEALELAQSMVLRRRPLSIDGARIALSWLKTTSPTLLPPFREILMDKLLGDVKQWPEDILLDLDGVTRTGRIDPIRMPQTRIALISAELDGAARHGTAAKIRLEGLPEGVWKPEHDAECEALVAQELNGVPDARRFDAVLLVASRFRLVVHLDRAAEAVRSFVQEWADNPGLGFDTTLWGTAKEPLWRELRAELTRRVTSGRAVEVGDAWHSILKARVPLPDSPLDAALLGAQVARSDPARRAAILEEALCRALAAAPDDDAVVSRTLAALWSRVPPGRPDYEDLSELLPKGTPLDPQLFRPVVTAYTVGDARLNHSEIALLRRLSDKELIGILRPVLRVLHSDQDVREVCRRLPRANEKEVLELARVLSGTAQPVRYAWAREIVDAMAQVKHPCGTDRLLRQVPAEYHRSYLLGLASRLQKSGDIVPVVIAFQLSGSDVLRREYREECLRWVENWVRKAGEKHRKQATAEVDRIASREDKESWAALLDSRDEGRSWMPWRRGKAGG